MTLITSERLYRTFVVEPGLERRALFEDFIERFGTPGPVLYAGSGVHVTPSFFFPDVTYVDHGEHARRFSADAAAVTKLIADGRTYARPARWRFLDADYTAPLPLPEGGFDLLLSLFAPGVARACRRYLRIGGLLLTSDHTGDADDARADGYVLIAQAKDVRGRWPFEDPAEFRPPRGPVLPGAVHHVFRRER